MQITRQQRPPGTSGTRIPTHARCLCDVEELFISLLCAFDDIHYLPCISFSCMCYK